MSGIAQQAPAATKPPPPSPKVPERGQTLKELAENPVYRRAKRALDDGLASVATVSLKELSKDTGLSREAAMRVRHLLIEGLVRNRNYSEALTHFVGDELPFWRGSALAGLGRLSEAERPLSRCIGDSGHPHRDLALLTLVSLLVDLGDDERAIDLLGRRSRDGGQHGKFTLALAELYLKKKNPAGALEILDRLPHEDSSISVPIALLRAEALTKSGAPAAASGILRKTLAASPSAISSDLRQRAALLLADSLLSQNQKDEANGVLVSLVETGLPSMDRLPVFDRLERGKLLDAEQLVAWASSPRAEVSRTAKLFNAQLMARGNQRSEAIAELQPLSAGKDSIATRAMLLLVELWLRDEDKKRAVAEVRAIKQAASDPVIISRIAFIEAQAHFEAADFASAADSLTEVPDGTGASITASYNTAIAALRAGDEAEFKARSALLPELRGDRLRANLSLERALYIASKGGSAGRTEASKALNEFLTNHPNSERGYEAHLALAGLALDVPPKPKSARESLQRARELNPPDSGKERIDYLSFWIEESDGEMQKAVKLADEFLQRWPSSSLAPSVSMRQAEAFYRNGDYLDALARFERLAAGFPESPLADRALFFAGRAAMLTGTEAGGQRALGLWQKLADKGSPLAPLARRHQAQQRIEARAFDEAVQLLELIIDDTSVGIDLKVSALILKGKSLAAGRSKEKQQAALDTFDVALGIKEITTAARNETLFHRGKTLESMGDIPSALAAYHQIVSESTSEASEDQLPEYQWFYRAGFESIRILESNKAKQSDIISAIAIADTLARTRGPRADEARKAAEKMRLENFVWRD